MGRKMQLFLLTEGIVLYRENSKSAQKILELINKVGELTQYKHNTKISCISLN